MVFLPQQTTSKELNDMLSVTKNGVAVSGSAAKGQIGPLIGSYDIFESDDGFLFRVALPGAEKNESKYLSRTYLPNFLLRLNFFLLQEIPQVVDWFKASKKHQLFCNLKHLSYKFKWFLKVFAVWVVWLQRKFMAQPVHIVSENDNIPFAAWSGWLWRFDPIFSQIVSLYYELLKNYDLITRIASLWYVFILVLIITLRNYMLGPILCTNINMWSLKICLVNCIYFIQIMVRLCKVLVQRCNFSKIGTNLKMPQGLFVFHR